MRPASPPACKSRLPEHECEERSFGQALSTLLQPTEAFSVGCVALHSGSPGTGAAAPAARAQTASVCSHVPAPCA